MSIISAVRAEAAGYILGYILWTLSQAEDAVISRDLGSRCELAVLTVKSCALNTHPVQRWSGEVIYDLPTRGHPLRALEPTHILQLEPTPARL